MKRRSLAAVLGAALGAALAATMLAGCSVPSDDDGEQPVNGPLAAAPARLADATPVVVDTDLGGDDLVALTFLLRHPRVRVEAITIAGTGLVGCPDGVDLVADLLTAADAAPVPIACGRSNAVAGGRAMPGAWRDLARAGSGLPRPESTRRAAPESADRLIARLADDVPGLVVVALGPLTNVAAVARRAPQAYRHLAGVHAMAGSLDYVLTDGVAEWNAAADPKALATVLAGPAPLTLVPDDAVPPGTPAALQAPVVGLVAARTQLPKWWDLATAAALVTAAKPDAVQVKTGRWVLDREGLGRVERVGPGPVHVVTSMDAASLEAEYATVFVGGRR